MPEIYLFAAVQAVEKVKAIADGGFDVILLPQFDHSHQRQSSGI